MSNVRRRRLLKSLLVGSGAAMMGRDLPQSWSTPVIESVVLPAHAGVSDTGIARYAAAAAVGIRVSQNEGEHENGLVKVVDGLVPVANAQIGEPQKNDGWYVCAVVDIPAGTAQVVVAGMGGNIVPDDEAKLIRRGNLKTNGEEGSVVAEDGDIAKDCVGPNPASQFTRPAKIVGFTPGDTQLKLQIFGDWWVEIIADLSQNGCLPEPPLATVASGGTCNPPKVWP